MIWVIWFHGLTVGVLTGIALRDAFDLLVQSRKERNMKALKFNFGRAFLTAALVVAVVIQLAVGILLIDSRRDQAQAERERAENAACTSQWQQQFAAAYRARLRASTDVNDAMERVVRAVAQQDPEQFKRAVSAYIEVRDTQEEQRVENPYPPLPNTLCGGAP